MDVMANGNSSKDLKSFASSSNVLITCTERFSEFVPPSMKSLKISSMANALSN